MSQNISKIDEIRSNMTEEATDLLDRLLTTKHANGRHVVSAPALAQLLASTCKTEISTSSVKRYRSKVSA